MWESLKRGNKIPSRDGPLFHLAEFMWRSRLNNRNPFDAILSDIAEFWPNIFILTTMYLRNLILNFELLFFI